MASHCPPLHSVCPSHQGCHRAHGILVRQDHSLIPVPGQNSCLLVLLHVLPFFNPLLSLPRLLSVRFCQTHMNYPMSYPTPNNFEMKYCTPHYTKPSSYFCSMPKCHRMPSVSYLAVAEACLLICTHPRQILLHSCSCPSSCFYCCLKCCCRCDSVATNKLWLNFSLLQRQINLWLCTKHYHQADAKPWSIARGTIISRLSLLLKKFLCDTQSCICYATGGFAQTRLCGKFRKSKGIACDVWQNGSSNLPWCCCRGHPSGTSLTGSTAWAVEYAWQGKCPPALLLGLSNQEFVAGHHDETSSGPHAKQCDQHQQVSKDLQGLTMQKGYICHEGLEQPRFQDDLCTR